MQKSLFRTRVSCFRRVFTEQRQPFSMFKHALAYFLACFSNSKSKITTNLHFCHPHQKITMFPQTFFQKINNFFESKQVLFLNKNKGAISKTAPKMVFERERCYLESWPSRHRKGYRPASSHGRGRQNS